MTRTGFLSQLKSGLTSAPRLLQAPQTNRGRYQAVHAGAPKRCSLMASRIALSFSHCQHLGVDMDDVKAVIEQATDAAMGTPPEALAEAPKPEMGTLPEAPAEAPKPEMAPRRKHQRKRRSLRGRKSGGPQRRSPGRSGRRTRSVRKPKSQPRNPQRKRPRRRKPRKRRQRKRSAEVKRKPPDEGPEVFCYRLLEGEPASRRR